MQIIEVSKLYIEQAANGTAKLVASTDEGKYYLTPSDKHNFHLEFTAVDKRTGEAKGTEEAEA